MKIIGPGDVLRVDKDAVSHLGGLLSAAGYSSMEAMLLCLMLAAELHGICAVFDEEREQGFLDFAKQASAQVTGDLFEFERPRPKARS